MAVRGICYYSKNTRKNTDSHTNFQCWCKSRMLTKQMYTHNQFSYNNFSKKQPRKRTGLTCWDSAKFYHGNQDSCNIVFNTHFPIWESHVILSSSIITTLIYLVVMLATTLVMIHCGQQSIICRYHMQSKHQYYTDRQRTLTDWGFSGRGDVDARGVTCKPYM